MSANLQTALAVILGGMFLMYAAINTQHHDYVMVWLDGIGLLACIGRIVELNRYE